MHGRVELPVWVVVRLWGQAGFAGVVVHNAAAIGRRARSPGVAGRSWRSARIVVASARRAGPGGWNPGATRRARAGRSVGVRRLGLGGRRWVDPTGGRFG